MNTKTYQTIFLGMSLALAAQLSYANSSSTVAAAKKVNISSQTQLESGSLIAKAVEKKHLLDNQYPQNIQMLASIQAKPSQNFLAEQNQRFTRFIQALFG
jgi:hypothetical protein